MSLLAVTKLSAGYGAFPVLKDISFTAGEGMLIGVLGENGSGKSTLLKSICGILPHSGTCSFDGTALEGLQARQLARLCGYIPQRSGITIDISVLDVVLMGFNPRLGLLQQPDRQMHAQAMFALEQVGLLDFAERSYLSLSEGQKQLCILARTLVTASPFLLLDEPESALDFRFRHSMLSILRNYISTGRRCALISLHDPGLALNSCDRILLLHGGSICGDIVPRTDSLPSMEEKLKIIYGQVSLHAIQNHKCKMQLAMLKEDESP